jgi:serine/threonine-protein kinase
MSDSTLTHPTADRNVLFGTLALQLDFIDRDDLITALSARASAKDKPLGELLLDLGCLSLRRRQVLEALVEEHLDAHHGDPRQSLAALAPAAEIFQVLAALADPDVQTLQDTVILPRDSALSAHNGTSASADLTGERYQIVRRHAEGGLGEVFVALDRELRREVALKAIRPALASDRPSRERFLQEAEITGALEHPGVVPVYGLGQYADGRPFYAMRLIRGETLKEAIHRFHDADWPGRDAGERGLALRQLLHRFIAVCNAVAYAHNRGVLHRDLKPSNILLGKYGETLVVDWGLAKAVGDPPDRVADQGEGRLQPRSSSDLATELGSTLGTPAYMSPEQAAGRWQEVGPASDVYSLGASLYHLLTGQAPVQGSDRLAILEKVRHGDWLPPRQVKKDVPTALDAVCRKALALRPGERYITALELAADLEHWLADEAVRAWREPWWVRLRRWLGRHQSLVLSVLAALGVALLSLGIATVMLTDANRREREARLLAERNEQEATEAKWRERDARLNTEQSEQKARAEKERADTNFRLAREAVDAFSMRVSQDARLKQHDLEGLRKALLQSALDFYQKLVRQPGAGESVELERGRAYRRLADLTAAVGPADEAARLYWQAVDLFAERVQAHPEDPVPQQDLALAWNQLGNLRYEMGRMDEAQAAYQQALAVRERLFRVQPGSADDQQNLAVCYHNLGLVYQATGRLDQAEAAYRKALANQEELVRRHPDVLAYRSEVAAGYNTLGLLYRDTGRLDKAEASLRHALAARQQLARARPAVPEYQHELAGSHYNLALLLEDTGRAAEATEAFRQALAVQETLVRAHPTVASYQRNLAASHTNLGILYSHSGDLKASEAAYRQALAIQGQLTQSHPLIPLYQRELASTHLNLGKLYARLGRTADAEASLQQALALKEQLVVKYPAVLDYQRSLAMSYGSLGNLYRSMGRLDQAQAAFQKALAVQESLARQHPTVTEYAVALGGTYSNLGRAVDEQGKPAVALDWYAKAIDKLAGVARQEKQHVLAREFLRNAYWGRAETLTQLGRHAEALADWDRTIELADGSQRDSLRLERALVLASLGQHARAVAAAGDVAAKAGGKGNVLYRAAHVWAVAAAAVPGDKKLDSAERCKLSERYAAKGMELLTQTEAAGYFKDQAHRDQLKKDKELDILRSREDFKKLLRKAVGGA